MIWSYSEHSECLVQSHFQKEQQCSCIGGQYSSTVFLLPTWRNVRYKLFAQKPICMAQGRPRIWGWGVISLLMTSSSYSHFHQTQVKQERGWTLNRGPNSAVDWVKTHKRNPDMIEKTHKLIPDMIERPGRWLVLMKQLVSSLFWTGMLPTLKGLILLVTWHLCHKAPPMSWGWCANCGSSRQS